MRQSPFINYIFLLMQERGSSRKYDLVYSTL